MSRGGRGDSEVTANIEDAYNSTYLCVELFAVDARIVRRTYMCTSQHLLVRVSMPHMDIGAGVVFT